MALYEQGTIRDNIVAHDGTLFDSKVVFREALRYMMQTVIDQINSREFSNYHVSANDIMWVLTVPGMGKDPAKAFMRQAAEEAGMGHRNNLMLALEPEAASLSVQKEYNFEVGTKYIIVDAGGGTCDFACHELTDLGVRETHHAVGGPWGSTYVDAGFIDLLKELFSAPEIESFQRRRPNSWVELMDNWETAKLSIETLDLSVKINFPFDFDEHLGCEDRIRFRCDEYKNSDISYSDYDLKLDSFALRRIYEPVMGGIIRQIRALLEDNDVKGSKYLFLVGGFGECLVLRDRLEHEFHHMHLVRPLRPERAIVRGAVLFGLNPSTIYIRKSRYTYGTKHYRHYDPGRDDKDDIVVIKNNEMVEYFRVWVVKGQDIPMGEIVRRKSKPLYDRQQKITHRFYASSEKYPHKVSDEGCFPIGNLTLKFPRRKNIGMRDKKVACELKFGGTEILVTSEIVLTGKKKRVKLVYRNE